MNLRLLVTFTLLISFREAYTELASIGKETPSILATRPTTWHIGGEENPIEKCANHSSTAVDDPRPDSYEERLRWFAASRDIKWYLPSPKRDNPKCSRDLKTWKKSILNKEAWALRMVDSWGKSSDGMLYNNYETPGSYDECLGVKNKHFEGKYCSVYIKATRNSEDEDEAGYVKELRSRLGILSGFDAKSILSYRTYGTCIPNSCTRQELADAVVTPLSANKLSLMRIDCYSNGDKLQINLPDYLFLVYVFTIVLLMVLATFLASSKVASVHLGSRFSNVVRAFHPKENLNKLFRVDYSQSVNTITCLNGIRVISTILVVLCHQCGMSVHSSNIMNLYGENKIGLPLISVTISIASLSVDSFLFLSGLLLSWSCLKKVSSLKQFNLVQFYAYRFLRLTPAIAVSCFFFATWARHLMSGPWSSEFELITNACKKYWWKDVLYLFNFFPGSDTTNSFPACLGQCWYTAVDTQLYLIAPLLLLPLAVSTSKGVKLLVVSTVVAIIIPTLEILLRDLPPTNIFGLGSRSNVEFYKHLYVMPWNRAGPWMVGIWTGLIMHRSSSQKQVPNKNIKVMIGWLTSLAVAVYVVKTMVGINVNREDLAMSELSKAVFGGVHRTAWASALAWVVYACHNGYGGIVNDFLSYPGFQPLSKLTYSVFLLSLNIQFALAWSAKQQPYFSYFDKVLETCGALFLSVVGAILLNLWVEIPTANILSLSLAKNRSKTKSDETH